MESNCDWYRVENQRVRDDLFPQYQHKGMFVGTYSMMKIYLRKALQTSNL